MAGVFNGLEVLDLSWGISGPIVSMLLADNGARVTRIEPPGGAPFPPLSGRRVWDRGKRSAVLDLHDDHDRARFVALATYADVVLESFSPGTAERLGIGYDTLAAANPRVVYCAITGYGDRGRDADRPGYDALVSARTGQLFESRGVAGTTIGRLSGFDDPLRGVELRTDLGVGPGRDGPLFFGVPWPSIAAAHFASVAVSAALRVRQQTGRGQRVATSLMQAVLGMTGMAWQRVEHPDAPRYLSWVVDPRAPKAFFRTVDGQWVHQWFPVPADVLAAGAGDHLTTDVGHDPPLAPPVSTDIEELPALHEYLPRMAEAFRRFTADDWQRAAEEIGFALQPVRPPEAALSDPLLLADGCVVEVEDPDLGPIRHVGHTYRLGACPTAIRSGAPRHGDHTGEVIHQADALRTAVGPVAALSIAGALDSPLAGVVVLDLGLAVAGPWAGKLLADLGADVIKVGAPRDFWLATQFGINVHRGKRSLAVNLKHDGGREAFERLVARADVVIINWRPQAVTRLGLDYDDLRRIKPDLIYCQTHGFERSDRRRLPGSDQMAGALAGTEWLDGGVDNGGEPLWPVFSLGDTGNGFLAALAVVQALYHRDRTGEGQLVETSIMYAHLLNTSFTWVAADGSARAARPSLDADLRGWSALYRLYEAADGWLCVAAVTGEHWASLCTALEREDLADDPRFETPADRAANDGALATVLDAAFAERTADEWFERLDAHGVPCEVARQEAIAALFDDPSLRERGWIESYDHPVLGRTDTAGRPFELSASRLPIPRPAPVSGQHTAEILRQLGYDDAAIDALERSGAVEITRV